MSEDLHDPVLPARTGDLPLPCSPDHIRLHTGRPGLRCSQRVENRYMTEWYKEDLAYIHDVGHGHFALGAAPGILEILDQGQDREGLVVDLGCGSGLWARELIRAGYRVLGIDISEAMIDIARRRVPEAEFRVGSLFEIDFPPCEAVTAVGEVLNYLFDPENGGQGLARLFRRVYRALVPGGAFVFDVAGPGQVRPGTKIRGFAEGDDWVLVVEEEEDAERRTLTWRFTSFRKVGEYYRRDDEVHRQRLYKLSEIAGELRRAGFRVRTMRSYGQYELPRAVAVFVARKPA